MWWPMGAVHFGRPPRSHSFRAFAQSAIEAGLEAVKDFERLPARTLADECVRPYKIPFRERLKSSFLN